MPARAQKPVTAKPTRKRLAGHVPAGTKSVRLKTAVEAREIVIGLQRHGIEQSVIAEATSTDPRSVYSWKVGSSPRRPRYDRLAALRDVVTALDGSLTNKGIAQWLQAKNRYLDGRRPVEVLADGGTDQVLQAAHAYAEGVYL
ncbi:MAG: hypothetical protein JWN22_2387 [Nocardioides sp.]|nr:hypothetical protein [Nocardioides sp.]